MMMIDPGIAKQIMGRNLTLGKKYKTVHTYFVILQDNCYIVCIFVISDFVIGIHRKRCKKRHAIAMEM